MKCPMCDKVLQGKQKFCSGACRVKASRQKDSIGEVGSPVLAEEVKPKQKEVVPEKIQPTETKGHWVGKAPHKPLWTSCERVDCPHLNNPVPDWTPTCERACCAD